MKFINFCISRIIRLFSRSPKSCEERLNEITAALKKYESQKSHSLSSEKQLVKGFLIYSMMLYFILTAITVIYVRPTQTRYWFIYILPVVALPVMILYIKRIIHWFYVRRINFVDEKITELKKETKQLLCRVMQEENYMNAKKLLDKFDPRGNLRDGDMRIGDSTAQQQDNGPEGDQSIKEKPNMMTSRKAGSVFDLRPTCLENEDYRPQTTPQRAPIRLPRPLIEQNRSALDKVVDFLVGDGFGQRYALICGRCHSHNGMALADEFQFICFNCAYCFHFNPARKQRPEPPTITNTQPGAAGGGAAAGGGGGAAAGGGGAAAGGGAAYSSIGQGSAVVPDRLISRFISQQDPDDGDSGEASEPETVGLTRRPMAARSDSQ